MEENKQLVELLDYDNPRKAEYQRLVQESEKKQRSLQLRTLSSNKKRNFTLKIHFLKASLY